jgi:hypothetical protein
MNRKHEKTLAAIFADPVRANIAWDDVISLFEGLGASVGFAGGSMVTVVLNNVRAVFHRPHPGGELPKPLVRRVRLYLDQAGVGP